MDSAQNTLHSIERLVGRLKLLPLIESCEMVWPNKFDLELILPTYEEDLLMLDKSIAIFLEQISDNQSFQTLLIVCLYESTAFILSEELAEIQKAIRKKYIWDYLLMELDGKLIVDKLYKHYKKLLLCADWFYNFGDLTSFWNFTWDLLEKEAIEYTFLDRDLVDLIEKVCFKLLKSSSVQLCIKGVTIIEECIYRTRGRALVDYETVYGELMTQTWRLFEDDERNQQISIVLLAALLECVRIIEVDKNQLGSLIKDFRCWSKADALMEILVQSLDSCKDAVKTLFLLEQIVILLTIDQPNIRFTQFSEIEANNDRTNNVDTKESYMVSVMDKSDKFNTVIPDWLYKVHRSTSGRFHRWSMKLLETIVVEVEKIENSNTAPFQYLACILFFIIDCPGLVCKVNSKESFNEIARLMISFLEMGAKHLHEMYTQRLPASRTRSGYVHCFSVSVNLVKEFMEAMISNNEKLMDSHNNNQDVFYGSAQILPLMEVSHKAQNWLYNTCNVKEKC